MSSIDYISLDGHGGLAVTRTGWLSRVKLLTGAAIGSLWFAGRHFASILPFSTSDASKHRPQPFMPKQDLSAVCVKPSPPGFMQIVSPPIQSREAFCIFSYGNLLLEEQQMIFYDDDEMYRKKNKPKMCYSDWDFHFDVWLYGARLDEGKTYAYPTGKKEDVVKGNLICFPENEDTFAEKLHVCDDLLGLKKNADSDNFDAVRRQIVSVIDRDGDTHEGVWYFKEKKQSSPAKETKHQPQTTHPDGKRVVILGGGIIGSSVAYYLAMHGVKATVIERETVACAASGKAGGFLAREWGYGPTKPLHQKSYDLHKELAKTLKLATFRELPTLEVITSERKTGKTSHPSSWPDWLDGEHVTAARDMGGATGQVSPRELTEAFIREAVAKGATLQIGTADGLVTEKTETGATRVTGVKVDGHMKVDGHSIAADTVVVALGPWTVYVEDWLNLAVPMEGIESTSIIYSGERPGSENVNASHTPTPADSTHRALFCNEDPAGRGTHLEVYPRPGGDVYVCGIGGSFYRTPREIRNLLATKVMPNPERAQIAHEIIKEMAPSLIPGRAGPDITQACMRPCFPDALPMLGFVPDVEGIIMAAGHNCWGILWAPITGKVVSELVREGHSTTLPDLRAFNPARFGRRG
eukprot:g52621.t1